MRLTAKIVVALVLGLGIVLGLFARNQIDEARHRLERDMREDAKSVGRLFRPNIARTWRLEGKNAAMYLIQYTNETLQSANVETKMRLRWVWLDAGDSDATRPSVPIESIEAALGAGNSEASIISPDDKVLYTYVPVDVEIEGEPHGALEISESTEPIDEAAAKIRTKLIETMLILAAICLGFIVFVGTWFVGRPLRLLASAADQIGAGDLTVRLDLRQKDEVGKLAGTINQTVERLEVARERVAAETESRLRAVDQLRHADRLSSVGTFASGIAHELGTPLAVVSGRAKLIADGIVTGDEVVEHANSISRQADKMAAIIRQLLDFARRRSPTLSGKDLYTLTKETLGLLAPLAAKRQIKIELAKPERAVKVAADGVQLQQVITNLTMNAIDAMDDGKTVRIELGAERAAPPAGHGGPETVYAYCRVIDEGPGIPESERTQIFEPFFTTKPVGKGTGLGLAVSHGIVSEHGGWIDLTSELGVGTTFSVYLPTGGPPDGEANTDRR